jgi:hypothetical protein
MTIDLDRNGNRILLLFLLVDIVVILLHCSHTYLGFPNADLFSLEWERGYGEFFQYIKEFWITALLVLRSVGGGGFRSAGGRLNLGWGLLFLYLLADDSLQIHETMGGLLGHGLGLATWIGEKSQDLGEILVSLIVASLLFSLIGLAHYYSSKADRQLSIQLGRMILALALCGIVIDGLHSLIPGSLAIWPILEDGGEMIVMSLIVSHVFQLEPIARSRTVPQGEQLPA